MTGILWAVVRSPIQLQPLYPNGQAHHITLQYGVERELWADVIGLPVTVGAIAHCHNERVQAIAVALPTWVHCQNKNPHITVSWLDDATPVEANVMLQEEHKRIEVAYPVHCQIEFLEWDAPDRQRCRHPGCEKITRSKFGYCRSHLPNAKYR